jgi:cytochrome P450
MQPGEELSRGQGQQASKVAPGFGQPSGPCKGEPRSGSVERLEAASASDPRALFAELREHPVVRVGEGMVVITRRRDVEAALRLPQVFSSKAEAVDLGNVRPLIPLQIDPPKHVKYRRILDPLFAPRKMAALEEETVELVDRLMDRFVDQGACDFHQDFAVPLPCTVFLRLMGLPLEELDVLLALKEGIIRPPGHSLEEQQPIRNKTAQQIYEYFERAIDRAMTDGRDDHLLAAIMRAEVDGERLTREEVLDICFLFLIAGLDTVTDSLDCIFAHLAQHPEHRQAILDDPSIIPSALEELMRWESPVPGVARVATQDTEIEGCPIKTGTSVILMLGSANTDPEAMEGAEEVDLRRNPNPHLAFGGGVHRCLGSHLARVELRTAIREFHRRIPHYELAPGAVLEFTTGLRSVEHLPLVFERQPVGISG